MSVTYKIDKKELEAVRKKLGDLGSKAPTVISRAINKTAVSAREKLAKQAQDAYTVKISGFKKDMQITKANRGRLEATIHSEGKVLSLARFSYSKTSKGVRVKVLKSSGRQLLDYGGAKAFIGTKEGSDKDGEHPRNLHGQIYQRRSNKRYPIKRLSSNSVPKMIGSEKHVYGIVKPDIQKDLQHYLEQQISLLVGGKT